MPAVPSNMPGVMVDDTLIKRVAIKLRIPTDNVSVWARIHHRSREIKMKQHLSTALTASTLLFICAPTARADESSYLADLSAHNIPVLIPASAVSDGFRVCREIREGESPQTAAQTFGIYYNVVGATIVDIAQHDLCPDTLR